MTGAPARWGALDAFRGLTIAFMILVNNPGSWGAIYPPLRHASWHGCTPTDLVFPFFLFIVGVAIAFALERRIQAGEPRGPMVAKILKRVAVLFGLGLVLSGYGLLFDLGPDFGVADLLATIRIPGVLQRIAVCYGICALLLVAFGRRVMWPTIVVALLGYWALMMWVPVPGWGPGQIDAAHTNLAAWLDRSLLGAPHLWVEQVRLPGAAAPIPDSAWDPEGVVSTLPAVATAAIGVLTGSWLRSSRPTARVAGRLAGCGLVLLLSGLVWDLVFPINKPIWTSSYVVYTAGLAQVMLAAFIWLIDVRRWRGLHRPLAIYGVNAITVFVLSGLLGRTLVEIRIGDVAAKTWLFRHGFESWLSSPQLASLGYAVIWVLAWFGVLAWMHRRGIIIKV